MLWLKPDRQTDRQTYTNTYKIATSFPGELGRIFFQNSAEKAREVGMETHRQSDILQTHIKNVDTV